MSFLVLSGLVRDLENNSSVTLEEAIERDLVDGQTATFAPPRGVSCDLSEAVARGLLDANGRYMDASGESVSMRELLQRKWIRFQQKTTEVEEADDVTQQSASVDRHMFAITGAIDPTSGERIDVATALERGVIDVANGSYVTRTMHGATHALPISDAIKQGLIFATTPTHAPAERGTGAPKFLQETQTFTIKGVVDPATGRTVGVSQAIASGLLDQAHAQYVDARRNVTLSMTDAIARGLVIADVTRESRETEAAEPDSHILSQRNVACTIESVRHPVSGVWLAPSAAIEAGVLDRDRGSYINPRTGHTKSLYDAIDAGDVRVTLGRPTREERAEKVSSLHIDDLEDAREEMGTVQVDEEHKTFAITGVLDPRSQEIIPYSDALDCGLVIESRGVYVHPTTRQEMSIPEALTQGIIVGELRSAVKKEVMMGAYKAEPDVRMLQSFN